MKSERLFCVCIALSISLTACTTSGEIYDPKRHPRQDFSAGNTAAAVLGTAAVVALAIAAAQNGGGGYRSYSDYDWAWDYQPMSATWACRGKQTGQYAYPSQCRYDPVNDYTWPG